MRNRFLAATLLLLASAACDDVDALGPDAGAPADAGTDGDAAPATPAAVVAQELPDAPSLTELTWASGQLGMVIGSGGDSAQGRVEQIGSDADGAVTLRRGHRVDRDEAAMIGQVVTLFEHSGARCAATVTRLVEVAEFVPDPELGRRSKAALWRVAEERGAVTVVAELSSACAEPLVAGEPGDDRAATAPVVVELGRPVAVDAIARLRALPRFAAAQAEYRAAEYDYDPARPDWSEDAEPQVTEFTLAGRAYVTAALERPGSCGDFYASMFAVWQRQPGGDLRRVVDTDAQPAGYDLVFDVDHDGVPEFAATPGREVVYETVEYDGCGC
ncbi:MAG: hypothetical protein JNK64_02635 [Myxococcales bacterium]|nr:hypothetical protein [Myxococcales bacterium]